MSFASARASPRSGPLEISTCSLDCLVSGAAPHPGSVGHHPDALCSRSGRCRRSMQTLCTQEAIVVRVPDRIGVVVGGSVTSCSDSYIHRGNVCADPYLVRGGYSTRSKTRTSHAPLG